MKGMEHEGHEGGSEVSPSLVVSPTERRAGTRDWALARESLERPSKAGVRSPPAAGPVLGIRASRLLLCGMGVEQNKLISLHGALRRPYRLPFPCSRGGAHFVSCANLSASHDQLPRAAFAYVLNSVAPESQLGGRFDRGPIDVRGSSPIYSPRARRLYTHLGQRRG
jgi:hypothetical protein